MKKTYGKYVIEVFGRWYVAKFDSVKNSYIIPCTELEARLTGETERIYSNIYDLATRERKYRSRRSALRRARYLFSNYHE